MITKKMWGLVLVTALIVTAGACTPPDDDDDDKNGAAYQTPAQIAGYVGSASCETCHESNYRSWKASRHNQSVYAHNDPAGPGIVADSDFDGINDFMEGLVLGDTSVTPADGDFNDSAAFKPMFDAGAPPTLGYDAARGTPTIAIGAITYDVAYVAGGKWKQLYVTVIGNSWYVLPAQYNPGGNSWSVFSGEDWYAFADSDGDGKYDQGEPVAGPLYTAGETPHNQGRAADSWQRKCAGCHVTGLVEVAQNAAGEIVNQFSENNISCEACHGPGENHVNLAGGLGTILNPEDLDPVMMGNLCGRCHTRGESRFHINGKPLGWPWAGQGGQYPLSADMSDYFVEASGADRKWQDAVRTMRADQLQYPDFKKSPHYAAGVRCDDCHDPHGGANPSSARINPMNNALCLSCHGGGGIGPVLPGASVDGDGKVYNIKGHTFPSSPDIHKVDPNDMTKPYLGGASRCTECHMPYVAKSSDDHDLRSHHFKLLWPQESYEKQALLLGRPNSCMTGTCHTDLSSAQNKWDPEDPNDLFNSNWMVSWGWPDLGPVASAVNTRKELSLQAGDSVTISLDGAASYDPTGQTLSYKWFQFGGPRQLINNGSPPTAVTFDVNADLPGSYLFELEVMDTDLNMDRDTVLVNVAQ